MGRVNSSKGDHLSCRALSLLKSPGRRERLLLELSDFVRFLCVDLSDPCRVLSCGKQTVALKKKKTPHDVME